MASSYGKKLPGKRFNKIDKIAVTGKHFDKIDVLREPNRKTLEGQEINFTGTQLT